MVHTYTKKVTHCLSEILNLLNILYFYLMNLAILSTGLLDNEGEVTGWSYQPKDHP